MVKNNNNSIDIFSSKKVEKSNIYKKEKNNRKPISSFLLNDEQLNNNNYFKESDYKEGWAISNQLKYRFLQNDDEGDENSILAIDCEMCRTEDNESELTRISILNRKKKVLLDEYVLPEKRIIDYLTQYSGITLDHLKNVTTRLSDIHIKLDKLVLPHTILMGHSLERDFKAMKFIHRKVIDTSILYLGLNGKKIGLKKLADSHLNRTIQNNYGHNSIEDAETVLDLVKLKIKGKS